MPPYTTETRSNTEITKEKTSLSDNESTQKRGSNIVVAEFKDEEAKINKEDLVKENRVGGGNTSTTTYPLSQFAGPNTADSQAKETEATSYTRVGKETEATSIKNVGGGGFKPEESSHESRNVAGVQNEDTATFGGDTKKTNGESRKFTMDHQTNQDTVPEQPEQTEHTVDPVIIPQNKRIKSKLKQGPRRSLTEPRKEDDQQDDIDDFDGVENRRYPVKIVDSSNDAELRAIMDGNGDINSLDYQHSNNPSSRMKGRKPPGVTFGGVEINEMSGMYTGKYSKSAVEEDGTMLEKESIGTGFCGFCKPDHPHHSRRSSGDSGCNIF